MGEAWDEIAPGVRTAHTPPFVASGVLRIQHSHSGVSGFIARHIMLPPEGDAVNVRLEVRNEAKGVRWIRDFGSMKAESLHTFRDRVFVEVAGPFAISFRTERHGRSVEHVHVGTRLFGLPVPSFMGPVVEGMVSEGVDDLSWKVFVDIRHRWFGSICRYEGEMRIE